MSIGYPLIQFFVLTFVCISSVPNTSDRIFAIVRELAGSGKAVKIGDIMDRCTTKGFKPDQVDKCIDDYEELNVWQVNMGRTKITFM